MGNLSSDTGCVFKDQDELEGVAPESLQGFPLHYVTGQREVKLKNSDFNAVLTHCNINRTLKEVYLRSNNIFSDNIDIFKERIIFGDESAVYLNSTLMRHSI
jgi:metallopeptidase MepB